MTQKTRNELKELFKTGAKPSGDDFQAFIDSTLNIKDDGIEKPNSDDTPLKITAQGADEKLLDFYAGETKTWSINQKSGLNISNAGGTKLFIESGSGNVGIGTTEPQAKLQIVGEKATVERETKELLRFQRPSVSNVKNDNSASIAVGAMEDGVNGKTRLDFKLSGTPNRNNSFGRNPDVDVITMLGNGNVGIGTTNPGAKLEIDGDLKLQSGVAINNFSTDATLKGNSDLTIPTEKAIKTYADTKALLAGSSEQDFSVKNLTVNGNFGIDGLVGIGTNQPKAKLHIVHKNEDANGECLILGPRNQSNLRLGYNLDYTWIQSHMSKPLAINPRGNNVGIGTREPEEQLHINKNLKVEGKIYGDLQGKMYSNNGKYCLILQDDRNICIRDTSTNKNVWCTGSHEKG